LRKQGIGEAAKRRLPVIPGLLRQNVTERSEDHVLIGMGLAARADRAARAATAPGVAHVVRVLCAPLNGALLSLVEAIPESN
jgi:hypothetical protein